MTSLNMVHAKEWMKKVAEDNLILRPSGWEPSWFRAALTRTEERNARRAAERKPRPIKEKEVTIIPSPELVASPRVREPKKPKVILRKKREGFSSLFDEE
jgi:hypothetical protein